MKNIKKWLKKIPFKQLLLASTVYTVIAFVVHQLEAFFTMKYYLMPEYFGIWSKLMMPKAGPPPTEFYSSSLLFSFMGGFAYGYIYWLVKSVLPKAFWKRVFCYADMLLAVSLVSFIMPTYLLLNVPTGLLISWFLSSAVIFICGSIVFVKMIR